MKQSRIKAVLALVVASVVFLGILVFLYSSKTILVKQAYYSVQQKAAEKIKEIETSINFSLSSIKLLSQFTTSHMTEKELKNSSEVFENFQNKTPFNTVDYIRWDGIISMENTGGESFDASYREYYREGIKGNTGIWVNYSPVGWNEALLNFYTPLYYENEITGVIMGIIGGITGMRPVIETDFFGQPITAILCDENLKVISSTEDNFFYGLNIKDYSENKLISHIIQNIKDNDSEAFLFKENGKRGIATVATVPSTNWKLIFIVLPKSVRNSIRPITNRIYIFMSFIIFVFLFYLFSYLRMQKMASKEIQEKQMDIINALGVIYENVYSINIQTSELFIYRLSNHIEQKYGKLFSQGLYENAISLYVEKEVIPEDHHLFAPILTVDFVKDIFEKQNQYSFVYRVKRNDVISYFECCLFMSSGNASDFVACFKNVDDMIEKQIANETRLNELVEMQSTQITILTAISGIYLTTHLINLKTDRIVEIVTSREVNEIVNIDGKATEQMERVMNGVVTPEYLDEVLAFTNLRTISKRLRGKKILSAEFIGKFHGWFRASFIVVEEDSEGIPTKVMFVTQVIENEKRREEKLINTANSDELTGLLNRHAYEKDLKKLKGSSLAEDLVYISFDVNGLKNVNDNLGHEAGDELLRGAAECISRVFSTHGRVYRTGGDEFQGIIYADDQDLEYLKNSFTQITDEWTGTYVDELSVSAGYVQAKEVLEYSVADIIKLADQRMYKAKSQYYISRGIDRRAQRVAFEVLCQSYTKILKIDLLKDEFSIIQMDTEEQTETLGYSEKISEWLHDFGLSGAVHRDDKFEYLRKTDIDFMRKYFEDGNKLLSIHYRRKIKTKFYNVMMEIIPSKDYTPETQIVYLYVKNIDKQ